MLVPIKTKDAARQLGCKYHQLIYAINTGRLTPPSKDSSGDYIWTIDDIERAKTALRTWKKARLEKVEASIS
jgi:DNA-binding transcriptional MerR regulator